jgi:hypothetical protein
LKQRIAVLLGGLGGAAVLALTMTGAGLAVKPMKNVSGTPLDTMHVSDVVREGTLPVATQVAPLDASSRVRNSRSSAAANGDPVVGDSFVWVGLDDFNGLLVLKFFTLRAIGTHGEVWVANNINFPTGDCRNGPRTTITDAQVTYMLGEFDRNMWPKETATFSTAPDRDGTNETITSQVPPNIAALMHPQGAGNRTVILVDNVRDDNFFDTNNANGFSYIAGFFSGQLNDFFDRNIMTIDAYDWIHRTGANPPNDPVPGNNCTSAPARPFLYEGTFAHEYQHLLEHYADPDEVNWINEGLSDWAQTLTGYVDPSKPITDTGFDSHTQCFLGWLSVQTPANPNPRAGGPENSLTRWGDQGDGEILCDYGAAYTMMEYLRGRFGPRTMTLLHNGQANGIPGLDEALEARDKKMTAQRVLHDWALMVALDGLIDQGSRISGNFGDRKVSTPTLHATVNWDSVDAYSTPGAPSNGSDYVRLRRANGSYVTGDEITSIGFTGSQTLPTLPVQWVVDANPPGQAGDPALFSGAADDRDEMIIRQVAVPSGSPSLTFAGQWNEEEGWDFGFAQVSTDQGATYESLTCTDTTTQTNPDAISSVKENVPGFTGDSAGWRNQTCSLSAYAGQSVLLAFRAINDPAVLGQTGNVPPGFWVDDVMIGGTSISDGSSLAGWKSFTETRPNPVSGYTVRIISMRENTRGKIKVRELTLTGNFELKGKAKVWKYVDRQADFVAAVVTYDDPSETATQYAPYRLTVNGVTQPGGGM